MSVWLIEQQSWPIIFIDYLIVDSGASHLSRCDQSPSVHMACLSPIPMFMIPFIKRLQQKSKALKKIYEQLSIFMFHLAFHLEMGCSLPNFPFCRPPLWWQMTPLTLMFFHMLTFHPKMCTFYYGFCISLCEFARDYAAETKDMADLFPF